MDFGGEAPEVVALVEQAAAGDPAAFGALYERFLDPIYRYFYYRTGHQAEAEDLSELVFLRAWQTVGRFRWQGRPFVAWLYRVAHNVHVDHVRAQRQVVSLDSGRADHVLVDEDATARLGRTVDADQLTHAMRQLTPNQRDVILLRFADGLETSQIAQMLDKREGAVRVLQMRAIQRLRRVLAVEREAEPT